MKLRRWRDRLLWMWVGSVLTSAVCRPAQAPDCPETGEHQPRALVAHDLERR